MTFNEVIFTLIGFLSALFIAMLVIQTSNHRITQAEISLGVVICEKAGGLRRIEVSTNGNHLYTCYNGTHFYARENIE